MTEPVGYMVDPDDFCRTCRGKGSYLEGGTCEDCGGTGHRSIRVTPATGPRDEFEADERQGPFANTDLMDLEE